MEAGSWVTGLHWQPQQKNDLEEKTLKEGKEVARDRRLIRQKQPKEDRRQQGKKGQTKRLWLVKKRKANKDKRLLAKGEKIVVF